MGEYSEECVLSFLKNQGQLYDEPVAETYEEAEEFSVKGAVSASETQDP